MKRGVVADFTFTEGGDPYLVGPGDSELGLSRAK